MKKRIILLSALLILLLPTICTAVEVFSGELKQDVETDIGGKNISLRYYEANDKISLNIIDEGKYLLVGNAECETSGLWNYCFTGADEREEEVNVSGKLLLKKFFYSSITVSKQAPVIELDMAISTSITELDKRFDITIALTNTGDLDSGMIDFEMELPENITVVSTTAAILGNKIVWSTPLIKEDTRDKKVTLRALDFGEYDFKGKATYLSAGTKTTVTDSVSTEVSYPYWTNATVSPELALANEVVEYSLRIRNDATDILDLRELKITVPPELNVKKLPVGFSVMNNVLTGTDQITAGKSKDYVMRVQTLKEGDYTIKTSFDIKIGDRNFKEAFVHDFGVGMSGIVPIINISDMNPRTYDPVNITVSLYNRDKVNITTEAEIKSDMFADTVKEESRYDPGKTVTILEKKLTAPKTEEARSAYVEVTGTYLSSRGITTSYYGRKEFTILPEEKVVKLTQDAEVMNGTVVLTVYLENLKDTELPTVEVFDLLPKGFKVTGAQTKTVSLNKTEKKMVLDYKITVPENYTKSDFLVEHSVNIKDAEGGFFIQEVSLRVNLKTKTYGATQTGNETEDQFTHDPGVTTEFIDDNFTPAEGESAETVKKPGIFSKIWRNIAGIFSTIFGSG